MFAEMWCLQFDITDLKIVLNGLLNFQFHQLNNLQIVKFIHWFALAILTAIKENFLSIGPELLLLKNTFI